MVFIYGLFISLAGLFLNPALLTLVFSSCCSAWQRLRVTLKLGYVAALWFSRTLRHLPFVSLFCLNFVPSLTFFCFFSLPLGFRTLLTLWPTSLSGQFHCVSIDACRTFTGWSVQGFPSRFSSCLSLYRWHLGSCPRHHCLCLYPWFTVRPGHLLVFATFHFDLCLTWTMLKFWSLLFIILGLNYLRKSSFFPPRLINVVVIVVQLIAVLLIVGTANKSSNHSNKSNDDANGGISIIVLVVV